MYPSCELYIPVNGGQTKTPTQTLSIHAGAYEIKLMSLLMATMSGSTGKLTTGDKPFIFSPQGSETAVVTIDMRASSDSGFAVEFNKVSEDSSNRLSDSLTESLLDYLHRWRMRKNTTSDSGG